MNLFKRTIPLLITATVGFVLIVASFIPATLEWGEVAMIWFDILAAVAFLLGGGNLVKVQLKKVSDQSAGWGYAIVTLIAFLATLIAGLFKIGAQPASNQEFYGQVFVDFPLDELPTSQTFRLAGEIPHREIDEGLPASVQRQLSEENGQIVFRGWITPGQVADLEEYSSTLRWRCLVEQLSELAKPPEEVAGKISYLASHEALAFRGVMSDEERDVLLGLEGGEEAWQAAVRELSQLSRRVVDVDVTPPPNFTVPPPLTDVAALEGDTLSFQGPMSTAQRDRLIKQFPIAVPMSASERESLRQEIESRGESLNEEQAEEFEKVVEGIWNPDQLIEAVNAGGVYQPPEQTACELLELAGQEPAPEVPDDEEADAELNEAQEGILRSTILALPPGELARQLTEQLEEAGDFTDGQQTALENFLENQPTIGQRNRALYFALLKEGPVSAEQKEFLLADLRAENVWQSQIVRLFQQAHQIKYPWSGDYRDQGTPFWWIYEFLFKPLTATMFALLAFYVASAAFRAFRAKNLEASLLLGTAFIILLGRTFAGVLLTDWLPEGLSGLRIENLAVYIMQVFNTAGNRAIMIGIALGIASTSLKVLLGIDRSYLGSSED